MLAAIAIVPSPPVLVPGLAGAAAGDVADLRAAAISAAGVLPSRWIAVGTADADAVFASDHAGTFAGYGVDVAVGLSEAADVIAELPLCALITGWLRGQVSAGIHAEVRGYRTDGDAAVRAGRRLRAEIDADPDQIGVLVVADGANTLTPAAPGGYHPEDAEPQRALDDALAGGDVAALARLPEPVVGRAAFAVLAGVAGSAPRTVKELYRGAPFGVGYFVGVWQP